MTATRLALAIGVLALIAPLAASPVLPFHDASGIAGLAGAIAHRYDPASRANELFSFDYGAMPSVLYFGWFAGATKLGVSVEGALRVFLALFCLAAPVAATVALLRTFGRPTHLALLALPIGYHHQIWYGFLGSAAAVSAVVLAPAVAARLAERASPRRLAEAAAVPLYAALAHPFALGLVLVAMAPLPFAPVPGSTASRAHRLGTRALRLAPLAPTALFLASWTKRFFAGPSDASAWHAFVRQLERMRVPSPGDAATFVRWLGGGYAGVLDDVVALLALAGLVAFLIAGARGERVEEARRSPFWPAWTVATLALAFVSLPDQVTWPTLWWGVRFRCVAPLFLVALALVPVRPRGLPAWATAPALTIALAWSVYLAWDFGGYFRGRVLDGFDEAIAAIPPGKTVLGLPAGSPDPHYALPHPYLVQHYAARVGGRAAPYLRGHPGSYWVVQHAMPASPPWGDPRGFDWDEHAGGFDYFLLERPMPGGRALVDPFEPLEGRKVRRLVDRGQWRLYENLEPTPPRRLEALPPS